MTEYQLTTFSPDEPEEWRPVVGHEDHYSVSSHGRVRRDKGGQGIKRSTPYIMKATPHSKKGALSVGICVNGKQRTRLIHHLVAEAFIGPRPEGEEVNHKDGKTFNNVVSNLEYCTGIENMAHAVANNLKSRGETHGPAKLSEEQVLAIRDTLANTPKTCADLARENKVAFSTISNIRHRITWKHLP